MPGSGITQINNSAKADLRCTHSLSPAGGAGGTEGGLSRFWQPVERGVEARLKGSALKSRGETSGVDGTIEGGERRGEME